MAITGMINPMQMFTAPDPPSPVSWTQQKAKIVTVGASPMDEEYVELEFQFNPETIKITKEVEWGGKKDTIQERNAPDLKFGGGKPAEFSLALVFDTSENMLYRDVRMYTNELLKLVKLYGPVEDRYEPPQVEFQWGALTLFLAVVEKVEITYKLFDPDGTPVRAEATVNFIQQDDSDDFSGPTNPTTRTEARKTRIVQQGDRLDLIAYQEYGAVAHWRHLAEANSLRDPRSLQPGQVLVIPPLP
jgi:hypothetical protein